MKLKEFFETNEKFTEEEIDVVLHLLDTVRDSLKDCLNEIISSISVIDIKDLKKLDNDFEEYMYMLKTCNKFYYSLEKYNDNKKWGKYKNEM